MLDVAVVTPRYPPVSTGGGETSAHLLGRHLLETDRIGSVTAFSFDGRGRETLDGVDVVRLGDVSPTVTELQNVRALRRMGSRLRGFDVVHGYNMELHPMIGYLSDRDDVPAVATLNSYHFFPKAVTNTTPGRLERAYELVGMPTTGRIMRHYMRRIDAFVALSRSIRDIYRENGFRDVRIEHVVNMIDPEFQPERGGSSGGPSLLYVGTLTENKGVEYLVRAVARLPESIDLRVVGDGDRRPRLERLARKLDVDDRVEFSGRVPYERIPSAYASANLFVHPGIWPEPLNRTVLEAMQAGLPVVCTDVGGPPEVIPDEEFLCPPEDPAALASTIERAVQRGEDVGERNRRHVLENHSPSVVVPRIVDVYESLIDDGRP